MLCVMVTREAFPKVAETSDGVLPRKAVKQPNKQAPSSGHQTKGKGLLTYLPEASRGWERPPLNYVRLALSSSRSPGPPDSGRRVLDPDRFGHNMSRSSRFYRFGWDNTQWI
ncbi:hypothetical protein CFRS1_v002656 [Colletotrichum fructicola]|nr:hypothetical protein CFRS1_v002656 [Colletotrichum fructicola]